MTNLYSLAQLQAQFAKQLTLPQTKPVAEDEHPLSSQLVASNFRPEQLISIYRNNFVISLRELLEQLFPITQALVGNDYFTQASRQFIQSCPLIQPHLNQYGGDFVGFLEELKALEKMPFVVQMAQLEWHLDRISHIYYQPNFDFDGLAQIGEDQYLNIHFSLANTCHLQTSSMDLIALHKDLSVSQKNSLSASTEDVNYQQESYILALQNQQGESALMPISQQHWAWLTGLKNGLTLVELCAIKNTDIAPLMAQITDWIALGCIDGFSLQEKTQP